MESKGRNWRKVEKGGGGDKNKIGKDVRRKYDQGVYIQ